MSLKRFNYYYGKFKRRLGPRVVLYVFLAIFGLLFARKFSSYVPEPLVEHLGGVDVQPLLASLTGTMLTISTFSLSIVITANFNATSSTTPRAFRLLLEDQGTQELLARFLGAFVFSGITLVVLPLGYETPGGRVILLFFTIWMVILILTSFMRWVMVMRELGSMSYALGKIENSTRDAMKTYFSDMLSGCHHFNPKEMKNVDKLVPVFCNAGLYLQLVDESKLQMIGVTYDVDIYINALEGDFISSAEPLLYVSRELSFDIEKQIVKAFYFESSRDLSSDPRFGLLMLEQTASKALSAAVNDPGTAVECVHTAYRLLTQWQELHKEEIRNFRVWKHAVDYEKMTLDFFDPITHDAADVIDVHKETIEALGALSRSHVEIVAKTGHSVGQKCFSRAMSLLQDRSDKEALSRVFQEDINADR